MLSVRGKSYKFNKAGDRAKDDLWIRSTELPKSVNGRNYVYTKKFQTFVDDNFSIYNSNIIDGVVQVIDLNPDLDRKQAAGVLGHEAFVHTDKDADALNKMDKKIRGHAYSAEPWKYKSDARRIATSSIEDHQALGRGEVTKYERYSAELVNATQDQEYLRMYYRDVQRH